MVLLFVITGVVRIGPALVESPVVPAPDPFREGHRLRIRWQSGQTG